VNAGRPSFSVGVLASGRVSSSPTSTPLRFTQMASHKVLRSVTRSLADSFTSLMNYRGDDYVMGHLLTAARASGASSLHVDLLRGEGTPAELMIGPVAGSVMDYCASFPSLVQRSGSDIAFVQAAELNLDYDLAVSRPYRLFPSVIESPYVCLVTIQDDRGRYYESRLTGWWFPEPRRPPVR